MTAAELLGAAAPRLAAAGIDSARLDAELLLANALGVDRTGLYTRLHSVVPADAAARFAALLQRRERREPLAYLTGEQEFWSLGFAVTSAVLIPRPETELLVELAVASRGAADVLDVGTGSGCIAIAVARELPAARITAVDVSGAALAVARANAERHGVAARIRFLAADVFSALADQRFDRIVSNPPYLAPGDAASPEVAFEPRAALFAGPDGLDVVRRLLAGAASHLRPGGQILVEIGQGQADAVLALTAAAGLLEPHMVPDLAGIPRVLVASRGAA